MATKAQQDRRKRLLPIVFVLIAAAALCLLALAAGWISSPLFDSWFGGGNGSGQTSDGGGDSGGGDSGGSCFLGLICFNASGSGEGVDADADVVP